MSRTVLEEMKINIRVLGVARWGRSHPRVKDPNLLRLDMITNGESPSKVSKRCSAVQSRKSVAHKCINT